MQIQGVRSEFQEPRNYDASTSPVRVFNPTQSSLVSLEKPQRDFSSTAWTIVTFPYQALIWLWNWLFGVKPEVLQEKCSGTSCHSDHASYSGGGGGYARMTGVPKKGITSAEKIELQQKKLQKDLQKTEEALKRYLEDNGIDMDEFLSKLGSVPFDRLVVYLHGNDQAARQFLDQIVSSILTARPRHDSGIRTPVSQLEDDCSSESSEDSEPTQETGNQTLTFEEFLKEEGTSMEDFNAYLVEKHGSRVPDRMAKDWKDKGKRPGIIAKVHAYQKQKLNSHILSSGISPTKFTQVVTRAGKSFDALAAGFTRKEQASSQYVATTIGQIRGKKV